MKFVWAQYKIFERRTAVDTKRAKSFFYQNESIDYHSIGWNRCNAIVWFVSGLLRKKSQRNSRWPASSRVKTKSVVLVIFFHFILHFSPFRRFCTFPFFLWIKSKLTKNDGIIIHSICAVLGHEQRPDSHDIQVIELLHFIQFHCHWETPKKADPNQMVKWRRLVLTAILVYFRSSGI